MKYLFYSDTGDSLGMCTRLIEEGHEVAIVVRHDVDNLGEGLVQRLHDGKFTVDKDTVIVFDSTGQGDIADAYREAGYMVAAGSFESDILEMDRRYAAKVMNKCGIKTPKHTEFTDFSKARDFVNKSQDTRFVFKPEDASSGVIPSFVAKDTDELLHTLDVYEKDTGGNCKFLLEEFTEGCECDVEIWASQGTIVDPVMTTFEVKASWNGNIGKSGGCAGNVFQVCKNEWLINESVAKLVDYIEHTRFTGVLALNFILAKDGTLYGLEFTPRFGYDATPTFFYELLDGELGEALYKLASGETYSFPTKPGIASGVRLTIPPWPSEEHKAKSGLIVGGMSEAKKRHFYPMNVMLKDKELVTSGDFGIVGIITGYGDSVTESFEEPYKILDKIILSNKQYRTDLVETFKKRSSELSRILTSLEVNA